MDRGSQMESRALPALLWFSVLGGVTAWGIRLGGSYAVVALSCDLGLIAPGILGLTVTEVLVLLLTAATVAISLTAMAVSWRIWQGAQARIWDASSGAGSMAGFLAFTGILLNLFFATVILLEGSAVFFIDVCLR